MTPLARPTSRRLLAPLLLLLLPGCFLFPFRPGTPDQPTVLDFDIEGTHAVPAGELKEHLVTQASERKVPLFFLRNERAFDEDAFSNDRRRILRYYQARGYYHARIESADVRHEGPGYVKIRIRVSEGDPVRVASIEVNGFEEAPQARARLRRLPLEKGDIFTEAAYDAARADIEGALKATGYERAEVGQHAEVDPARNEARIRYQVKPGQRYRYGGIFVAGAAVIPRDRVRAEALDIVVPGRTFDAGELPRVQQRVFDLGVFGGVRVAPGPSNDAQHTIPVVVSVREAPFRTIRLGPSLGVQLNRYDLSGVAGWAHRNWLGGLRRLNLDARVGYAWIPAFHKQGTVGLLTADFTQPGIARRIVDLNVRGELEKGIEPAYDFFAERFKVGTPIHFGRLFTFTPSVNLELYHLSNQPQVTDLATGQNLLLSTCPSRDPGLCLLSYVEQRATLDLRDDPINTREGFWLSLSVQEGFSAFGVGTAYLRVLPEARGFVPLPLGMVLALRARLGIVEPAAGAADVPIVAKFTSGGPTAMRGYYNRELSPVVLSCPNINDPECKGGSYVAVGGKGLIDGSLELRFPISGSLGGATFLDFGDARLSVAESLNVANLQYAAGVGLRYNTVFGPLRVDVAYRLPTDGGGQPGVQVVEIKGGGINPTGQIHHYPFLSVHLSIGEAF